MITVQIVENIKRGARITYFNGIYAILLGLYYLIFFDWILKTNFHSIDSVWQVFSKYNPQLAMIYIKMNIAEGLLIIGLGLGIMFLSDYILKRKDKTAWATLFVIGLILWPTLLTIEILNKNYLNAGLAFFGWVVFVIGMLIPVRYYFMRDEY